MIEPGFNYNLNHMIIESGIPVGPSGESKDGSSHPTRWEDIVVREFDLDCRLASIFDNPSEFKIGGFIVSRAVKDAGELDYLPGWHSN